MQRRLGVRGFPLHRGRVTKGASEVFLIGLKFIGKSRIDNRSFASYISNGGVYIDVKSIDEIGND